MIHVSIERLHEAFRLDPATGKLYRKIEQRGYPAGLEVGAELRSGYRQVGLDGQKYCSHRIVFAMTHGRWPTQQIDHINGDRGDNRPDNLREATNAQNGWNAAVRYDSASGIKGVSWHKQHQKWHARIKVRKRQIHLGLYDDIELAELVVEEARRKYHGEFANTTTRAAIAAGGEVTP